MRLTARRILFCQEYLKDNNPREAALRAGFRKSYVSHIAKKMILDVDIQAKINEILKQSPPTREWVLERLREEALHARADTARVRALATLAQSLGMLTEHKIEKDLADLKQILLARERAERHRHRNRTSGDIISPLDDPHLS